MTTRTFTTDELDNLDIPLHKTDPDYVLDEHLESDDHGWETHRQVFRHDGAAWEVVYRRHPDHGIDWFDDEVTAERVEARPVVSLEWQPVADPVDRSVLDPAVRALVNEVDYDIHKSYECSEETGEDTYPELVAAFEDILRAILTAAPEQQS